MAERNEVQDRLEVRRAKLSDLCQVDPVKQHLRLESYYRVARQLYHQAQVYANDGAWDYAYVHLARFIKLCSKVITAHRDYNLPIYRKEHDWVQTQAIQGMTLFDTILDGMETEETDILEYERAEAAKAQERTAIAAVASLTLEERLESLRRNQRERALAAAVTTSTQSPARSLDSSLRPARSSRVALAMPRKTSSSSTSLYPTVGKTSWMKAAGEAAAAPAPRTLSRHRSQQAIEMLSSRKCRVLEVPTSIIPQFTQLAAANTNRRPYGIETCGILAGVLNGSNLKITTLIIPKQDVRSWGSSDMCSMRNEEELFDFCFNHDLLTLGWIHTHPSQDCFLSSVDIHTQCGFQSILPEAVAIVVAPKDRQRNVGVFRLTDPGGVQLIQNCKLSGFHAHPTHIEIYSDALECDWKHRETAAVVDMR